MHHKYHTEAVILSGLESREANKYFLILTKELGLVGASAQGVRKLESKLRYALQTFSWSDVSLVKGKEVWRLTNAVPKDNFHFIFKESPEKLKVSARILEFLKRFLHGEEKDEQLFNTVLSGLQYLSEEKNINLKSFEIIIVLKILAVLGYLKNKDKLQNFIDASWQNSNHLSPEDSSALIKTINESISESHL